MTKVLLLIIPLALGLQEKIVLTNLENTPGILPLKLGNAKLQEYKFTLIHYYDLNPIVAEVNRLHTYYANLASSIINCTEDYHHEKTNYVKILTITKEKVETKLKQIIPHPQRIKRGMINGIGSIFKSITGNLDADDGERYENLIRDLQFNQRKLASNIANQNSISVDVINKFNSTIQTIINNEKSLQEKVKRIANFIEQNTYRENDIIIKDALNQLINMYEIIDSILQDIENSLSFAKLNIMHPSIIRTVDLYNELLKLQKIIRPDQFPLEVTLENTLIFEKIIKIESYILNNKITYLLHFPIMYLFTFEYYHLYSVPSHSQGQFKAILPNSKYLVKSKLYYAFKSDICVKIKPQFYVCEQTQIQEISKDSPCELQLLDMKEASACRQINFHISKPIINQLEDSTSWIGIFPNKERLNLKCSQQNDIINIMGSYVIKIPNGCQLITNHINIINNQEIINENQPIVFPEFERDKSQSHHLNISFQIDEIRLEDLQDLKNQILRNQPQLTFDGASITSSISVWTLIVYVILFFMIGYSIYRTLLTPTCPQREDNQGMNPETVQLPRLSP